MTQLIPDFSKAAMICVDLQSVYCDPLHECGRGNSATESVCKKIATQMPLYRAAGVPIIWLYMAEGLMWRRPAKTAMDGFYIAKPDLKTDTLIAKTADSGFYGDKTLTRRFTKKVLGKHPKLKLERHLQAKDIKTLIFSGVNLSACVKRTARGALMRGYDVVLLSDLTANDLKNPYTNEYTLRAVENNLQRPFIPDEWGSNGNRAMGRLSVMESNEALSHIQAQVTTKGIAAKKSAHAPA